MIIGNGNNRMNGSNHFQSNFNQRFNMIQEEGEKNQNRRNPFTVSQPTNQHPDVMNQKEMTDRAFNMLQERLQNGTISIEEFNKKCEQLNKMRRK